MATRRLFGEVCVPTLLVDGPYRFHFHSREHNPPHVHVRSADGWAVFILAPVELHKYHGYTGRDLRRVRVVVIKHREEFLRRWHEYFGR